MVCSHTYNQEQLGSLIDLLVSILFLVFIVFLSIYFEHGWADLYSTSTFLFKFSMHLSTWLVVALAT